MALYNINDYKAYAGRLGFSRAVDAEKDYLQELALYWLFKGRASGSIVFRGGTSISKLYGSGRFSEDLDFIFSSDIEMKKAKDIVDAAIKGILLQYQTGSESGSYRNMLKYTLKVRGPLFMASKSPQAVQTIGIDINLFERPLLKPRQIRRMPIYEDIPPYMLNALEPAELLADKIKALMERTEPVARDLYDAWLLCTKYNIKPDTTLVSKKMRLFGKNEGESFSVKELKKRVAAIAKVWNEEMPRLMSNPLEYKDVSEGFLRAL